MKKTVYSVLLTFVVLIFIFTSTAAQPLNVHPSAEWKPSDDDAIIARLTLVNPDAVQPFKDGSIALYLKNDFETAEQKFEEVLQLAPDFPDALRRMGHVYAGLKKYDEALACYRKAVEKDNSVDNRNSLAYGLLYLKKSDSNIEALRMIKEVISEKQDDINFNTTAIMASLIQKDYVYAEERAKYILGEFPDDYISHYLAGLVALSKPNMIEADFQFQAAKKLGAPAEMIDHFYSDQDFSNQLLLERTLVGGAVGLVGWIILLIVLFLTGISLSKLTIGAIKKQVQYGVSETTPLEKIFRWIYGVVVGAASAYFYLSIPILVILVILGVAGLGYLFLVIGQLPIRIALIIILVAFFTIVAIIRGLFIRQAKGDPGKPLARNEAPELWELLSNIASRLSTRPVQKVFVTPDAGIAVFERGNWLQKINNRGERCLILGLGALNGMTQGEFQAVIAHEYGHFINADTAGGNLAKRVRVNIYTMAVSMARSGVATWFNPVWWFINMYNKIFLRISHGASRLQEIQADRLAASYFGIGNFKKGLEHVIRNSIEFRYQLDQEVKWAQSNNTGLRNLYSLTSIENYGPAEADFRNAMSETTSPYDSHPSPMERFELIRNVPIRGSMMDDSRLMWDLLPNGINLQEEMTKSIETNLKERGYLNPA